MSFRLWIHRMTSGLKSRFLRMAATCSTRSMQTTIWMLILLTLIGTLYLNYTVEQNTRKINEEIQQVMVKAALKITGQSNTEGNATIFKLKLEEFNPFFVPAKESVIADEAQKADETKKASKQKADETKKDSKQYLIHWYNCPPYIKLRPNVLNSTFDKCKHNNCVLTFDRKDAGRSDAVLFDGRWVFERVGFKRPLGQVWVFAAHEAPITFEDLGGWWKKPQWRYGFNWTMTYDKTNTDIYLPYGELRKQPKEVVRDFKALTMKKKKTAVMINSHCPTPSYRENYVKELQKYIDIDVFGKCGVPWNCGKQYVHDDCFKLLNEYKFFLAFENAFCCQYFSEKVYDNFDYDTILVFRGGKTAADARELIPKGTVVSTGDFNTIAGLGKYLQKLSWSLGDYSEMLKRKSQYFSIGYKAVYQRALCDICERMNNQDKYRKHIPDITKWAYDMVPCKNATDLH